MKKILTILLPLLLILPVALQAQAGFDVLDMRSGLPETRIRALCQMPDGRMAIATAGTVTIFDGTRFTVHHLRPQDEYALPAYHGLRHLTCDSTGLVWLRNDGSLYVVDTRRQQTISNVDSLLAARQLTAEQVCQWPTDESWRRTDDFRRVSALVDEQISALVRDSYGGLWVGLKESGLLYSNPGRKRQFHTATDSFPHKSLFPFCSARASQLSAEFAPSATNCSLEGRTLAYTFLGTRKGIMIIGRNGQLVATLDERDGLSTNNVVSLLNDHRGDVWAATANGLTRVSQTGCDSFSIVNYGLLDGINTSGREFRTCQIHRDSTGLFTVGFVGGTITFHPDSVTAPRYTFRFPRAWEAAGIAAPASNDGLWWGAAFLLFISLGVSIVFLLNRRKTPAPEVRAQPEAEPARQTPAETTAGGALAQDIAQQAASTFSSSEQEFLDRLKAVIEQHISDEDFSVQSLSQMMAMDRTVLYRRMHTVTGVSPSVFVKNIRMDIASRLLLDTDLSVCDIAIKTGFSSTKYFSAAFKEVCGVTPSEFRAKKQAED
ncbi:MAG: helix-turn-helix domain-containing protein [Prevotella sp.]|nr:helix-turn-helix domain-containing protein [Prevotella sp.]